MRQPHVIRSLLTSALQLWLRSQVDQADALTVEIHASDRQLLSGQIPHASLQAEGTVYGGLHLSQLTVSTGDIRVNLRQILRGKSFQLAEAISIYIEAQMSADELNASLEGDLLSSGTTTVARLLLPQTPMQVRRIELERKRLILWGSATAPQTVSKPASKTRPEGSGPAADTPIVLSTQVLGRESSLRFSDVQLLAHPDYASSDLPLSLPDQSLPLGDVNLDELTITAEAIAFAGKIKVLP